MKCGLNALYLCRNLLFLHIIGADGIINFIKGKYGKYPDRITVY